MLHGILDDDHIQWLPPLIRHYTNFWPLLIWTLLPNLTLYLIVQGFHRTYATGDACQERTLTSPDTWFCPTLGLAWVLMSRPVSPELVLSSDFWVLSITRYFSFAYSPADFCQKCSIIHFLIKAGNFAQWYFITWRKILAMMPSWMGRNLKLCGKIVNACSNIASGKIFVVPYLFMHWCDILHKNT